MFTLTVLNRLLHQQQPIPCVGTDVAGETNTARADCKAQILSADSAAQSAVRFRIQGGGETGARQWQTVDPIPQLAQTPRQEFPNALVPNALVSNELYSVLIPGHSEADLDLEIREIRSAEGRRRVTLINRGRSVALSSGPRIHRGRTVELDLPISCRLGETQLQITDTLVQHPIDEGLTTVAQNWLADRTANRVSPGPETLAAWLEMLSDMQRVAAGTHQLYELAAQSVFNPGGLDGCLILQRHHGRWQIIASHLPYPDHGIMFREDLVLASVESRETLYHDAGVLDHQESFDDIHAAVVCPVVDHDDQVAAVVYGFRSLHRRNLRKGIRFLEAQFVQVVADSLSAGLIRLNSEADAARSQVLLEQAFTPKIARQLQGGVDVLQPRHQEVTVLFADLRGFSSMAERSGTEMTFDLLSDVMDQFSNAITDLDGVIIDFYGDGISAFWNAPVLQPEHPVLACQAAFEILHCLPELNQRWESRLGAPLQAGIGIHTGMASVGNSGSRSRLKYGPRGTTVNMASRLEGLTKSMGVPILISAETAARIAGVFETRQLESVQLDGHEQSTAICSIVEAEREFATVLPWVNDQAAPHLDDPPEDSRCQQKAEPPG